MADAFFSKETFVNPLFKEGFHVISRLRNDAVLFYPTLQEPTGKRGHPKWYDDKVGFSSLDLSRFEEAEVDKGRLFGLKTYSKSLKRCIKVAVWYPDEEDRTKWQIYFNSATGPQVIDKLFKELVLFTDRAA